jgi:UDP-N-acetylglucosamine--N-acetylmuramyl-(pentapeptide) pyrophosphoryl-undecaprenol N-acetylglucosamine transferase
MKQTPSHPTLCVVAGHSGGHILPARTLAYDWLAEHTESACIFFSTTRALDAAILARSDTRIRHIPLAFTRFSPLAFLHAIAQSYRVLRGSNVQKVITTGGIVAIPVCLAAALLRIPIELYELNAVPGKTTRFLAPLASKVFVCFAQAHRFFAAKKCSPAAYPLQPTLRTALSRHEARAQLGLSEHGATLLVMGGSQGSLFMNNLIKKWVQENLHQAQRLQIIHQTGSNDSTDWPTFYAQHNIRAFACAYYNAPHIFYAAADVIICRSGAGSLFEAVHYKKPCITIPLEGVAENHQVLNAQAMAQTYPEFIHVIEQADLAQSSLMVAQALKTLDF